MISLCMIVKDEIKFIEDCLKAVKPYVDEIVVADTGSTDGTIEVLEKYGCKVFHFEWCDDYSKARNFAISKSSNNWVLILDADEHVIEFNQETINKIVKSNKGEIIGLVKNRSFVGTHSNVQTEDLPRFFNRKYYSYIRDIHEEPSEKFNFSPIVLDTGIVLNHYGYLTSTREEKGKNEQYLERLKKSLEKNYDPYIVRHLAGIYLNLEMYEEAIAEIDKVLSDTSTFKEHYFPNSVVIKIKSLFALERYQEALEMQKYYAQCQHNDDFLNCMAQVFYMTGNLSTAQDIYLYLCTKKEISISRLVVIGRLAEVYFDQNNYKEAIKWYKMIEKIDGVKEKIKICEMNLI